MAKKKLPKPTYSVPVNNSLVGVAPGFVVIIEDFFVDLKKAGLDPHLFETLRTNARQEYLYNFGRIYDDGRGIVTGSRTGVNTYHYYGIAADIISQEYQWKAPISWYNTFQKVIAKHKRLRWGADWNNNGTWLDEKFRDFPHVQLMTPTRSPTPQDYILYNNDKQLFWRNYSVGI